MRYLTIHIETDHPDANPIARIAAAKLAEDLDFEGDSYFRVRAFASDQAHELVAYESEKA